MWNLEDHSCEWVSKLRDLYERFEGAAPQFRHQNWRKCFENEQRFSPLEMKKFMQMVKCSRDLIWERVLSKSYISDLSSEEQLQLRSNVLQLLDREVDEFRNNPDLNATVDFPYESFVVWSRSN